MHHLFAPGPPPAPGHAACTIEEQRAYQVEQGHGRREERTLRLSSQLAESVAWPYPSQVFQVTRTWTRRVRSRAASMVMLGHSPMAVFRKAAIGLLRRAAYHASAARLRHNSRHPQDMLPVLGLTPL